MFELRGLVIRVMIYRVFILKRDLKKTYICNILLFYINYKNLAYYNTKMNRIKFIIIYCVFKHSLFIIIIIRQIKFWLHYFKNVYSVLDRNRLHIIIYIYVYVSLHVLILASLFLVCFCLPSLSVCMLWDTRIRKYRIEPPSCTA